ncbi:hypothetical protein SAMD00019534_000440 [Acytostelium subglobosum LB1]|uniref:hypothetical protein n=1 Tax=Acytostelium subglobosum LB1 TaxID=1410327 RepID=UPI00064517EE|nr:hypothetical protein SAMD00019534_000440 [Acytostelium subglobosum LB1]GAM16869.1 hypothetical protein SAMD00019534_000440 [Acytostelium subglobosum LB1]|eukprot:XP_012758931.1 hypothetical protein SAMD00019534_000440 [Acytostelium subglobosum LB1]
MQQHQQNQQQQQNQHQNHNRLSPKKFLINHFDDSYPMDNPLQQRPSSYQQQQQRDEDDYRYNSSNLICPDDQLMFAIDDI